MNFQTENILRDLQSNSPNFSYIDDLLLNLALNHSVMISLEGEYLASSPDELALVNAAKYLGYEFEGRNTRDSTI